MKVIVIGATGTIGTALADVLKQKHEVVRASRNGPIAVDLEQPASIAALFAQTGGVDAVVCCAASAGLAPFESLDDEGFALSLRAKLFGQVSVVRHALPRMSDGGSITLTSGKIPAIPGSAAGALVNTGLEAFVRAAALEMPRGIRINSVSPGWVKETLGKLGMDSSDGTPAADVARAYIEVIEGTMNGRVIVPQVA